MAEAQTQETLQHPASIGLAWRTFQLAGLVMAVSWIVSYLLFLDGYTALQVVFGTSNLLWFVGGIGYFLSPLISVILITIAVWPEALAILHGDDLKAIGLRAFLFVIPFLWLGSVFVGDTAMVDRMLTAPLGHSVALPVVGGAFFHTVFQHWFQGFAAMLLALVPTRFSTLTDSDRPAGTGAVVRDVTAQLEFERRLEALHDATRQMMAADSPGEVARIASEATTDIVGVHYSRVHLRDEDTDELVPAAWTAETERVLDGDPPTVDPDSGLVWERFTTGEAGYFHQYDGMDGADDQETPLQTSLLLPLGDHGIMLMHSTEPAAFTDVNIELAHILSANTQAALARTARDRELALVHALLDQSSESVFVIDPTSGHLLKVNDPACAQLGYTRDELLSLTLHDVVAAHGEWADVGAVLEAAREQGLVTLEGAHRRKEGSTVPVHLTIKHVDLDREYLLAMARDITERTERREALAVQRAELECLGFVQTLITDIVQQVLDPTSHADLERRACELLTESTFYVDAWVVTPDDGPQPPAARDRTTDGDTVRTVDELPPEAPATEAIRDTLRTNRTHVLGDDVAAPAVPTSGEVPGDPPGDETVIVLPLTYGESNYGALVVVADRPTPVGARERAALGTLTVGLAFARYVREQDQIAWDEALELEFHATESTAVLSRLAATVNCPVRLEGLLPGTDDLVVHYYDAEIDTDAEADALRERIEATESVERCRILEHNGACLFEVQVRAADVLDRIVAAGAVVRRAVARPDGTQLVIDLAPATDPQEVNAVVQEADSNWTLTEQRQVDRPMHRVEDASKTLEDSLTDKQREALLTAYFTGYYDYPRTSNAQEVADTLAITDSTLFQHLQAAQRKLIEAWLQPTDGNR